MSALLLGLLKSFLTKKLLKSLFLQLAEEYVEDTETKFDDKLLRAVKKAL